MTFQLPEFSDIFPLDRVNDLIPELLPNGILLLYGSEKSGKSIFSSQLAKAVAEGKEFLGFACPGPRNVLYLGLDDKDETLRKRFIDIDHEHCVLYNYTHYTRQLLQIQSGGFNNQPLVSIDSFILFLKTMISESSFKPDLVVIDTFTKIRDQRREHDYDSEVNEIQKLRAFSSYGISFLLVSHKRKTADTYIGSAGTGAEPDALINFTSESNEVKRIRIIGNNTSPEDIAFKIDFSSFALERVFTYTEDTIDKDLAAVISYLYSLPNRQFVGTMQELAFRPRNGAGNRTAESLGKLIRKKMYYLASENIAVTMDIKVGKNKILIMKAYDYPPAAEEINADRDKLIAWYKFQTKKK